MPFLLQILLKWHYFFSPPTTEERSRPIGCQDSITFNVLLLLQIVYIFIPEFSFEGREMR
jgi:hypothetical protein